MFSKINIPLSELNGTPRQVLCKALELNNNGSLFKYSDKELTVIAKKYMNSIEENAKKEIKNTLGAQDGEDCAF